MPNIFIVGIIIFTGFIMGELVTRIRLPKVTGYILAGILLNPGVFNFIPKDILNHTNLITNISLSFITFSVGGTLFYPRIKKLGKGILYITLFEAEMAFILVIAGLLLVMPFFIHPSQGASWIYTFVPVAVLMASLASPTDPSATLAVVHEYKAKGEVSSTIMGVSAMDDVLGIINYSLAVIVAQTILMHQNFSFMSSLGKPVFIILGTILLGIVFGWIFNVITLWIKKESEGFFIVLIFALLTLCFGSAALLGLNELLATMTMGIVVVNFNFKREKIFKVLERYTEELIFALFFTISGMQLNFAIFSKYLIIVLFFVIFRILGKVSGTLIGATLAKSSKKVRFYTSGGLIPQGGIVVGLALLMKQNPAFSHISDIIISIIIGSTVIHELMGPVFAEISLRKAGEIK
ncbi:MAG: cation:proton antiporter [Candidatus Omnitrophota bacterium]